MDRDSIIIILLCRSDLTIGGELEHDYISKVSPRKTQKNITGSLHEGFEGFYIKNYPDYP